MIIGLLLGLTVVASAMLCAVILPLTLNTQERTPKNLKNAQSETPPVTQDTTESTPTQRPDIYTKNPGSMVTLSTITSSQGVADGKVIKPISLKYTVTLTQTLKKSEFITFTLQHL